MNKKKVFIAVVGGFAVGAHQALESEVEHAKIEKPFATKPSAEARPYGVLPHGNHPDHPSGPLRMPQTVATSTAGAVHNDLATWDGGEFQDLETWGVGRG